MTNEKGDLVRTLRHGEANYRYPGEDVVTRMLNEITEKLAGGKITSVLIDASDPDPGKHRFGLRVESRGKIFHAWVSRGTGSKDPGWLHIEEQESHV